MAHEVKIQEIINGVQITETIDGNIVVKLISHQSKPFLRTTNETDEETYQVLDIVGEIYNTPALATDFRIIDKNGAVFIPANGVELIEYSKKIRAFRPDDDGFSYHIGEITGTSNSITIGLADDNVNWAYINGSYYEKYYPDAFNFSPVTTGEKILIIYAKPDSQVFHLAQGAESTEAIEPSYNGLFVARILVNSSGAVVTENNDNNFKTKVDDTVYPIIINVEAGIWVYARFNTFEVLNNSTATTPILFGLISDGSSAKVWNGKRFYIKNSSGKILTLKKEPTPPIVGDTVYFSFSQNITLKDGETIVLFLNRSNELEPLKFIGGSASFPETGSNGDVLEKDSAVDGGVKWSNRLTNVEDGKLDKPTTDGSWVVTKSGSTITYTDASTLGQNIANTNLTWSADRTQNLNGKKLSFTGGRVSVPALELEITAENSVPNKIWTDGVEYYFNNNLGIKKTIAFKDDIFEHNVRGKRVELSGVGGATLNIDLNAGSFFAVTNTGTGNVQMVFTNMIRADESAVINVVVTGNLFTLPAGLIGDSYNDIPNVNKKRKYIFTIEKGGVSPIISYNLINV